MDEDGPRRKLTCLTKPLETEKAPPSGERECEVLLPSAHQINAVFGQNVWAGWWHYVKRTSGRQMFSIPCLRTTNVHSTFQVSLGISFFEIPFHVPKCWSRRHVDLTVVPDKRAGDHQTHHLETKNTDTFWLLWPVVVGMYSFGPLPYFIITSQDHLRQLGIFTVYSFFCWLVLLSLARNESGQQFCYMIFFPEEYNVHLCSAPDQSGRSSQVNSKWGPAWTGSALIGLLHGTLSFSPLSCEMTDLTMLPFFHF